jgi:ribonuclease BN (tRNA processing enzyme)
VTGSKPIFLFLSHFHLDHIEGLHILGKFAFKQGLVICGPEGTRGLLNTILNQPFSAPLSMLNYRTELHELPAEKNRLPFALEALPLLHTSLTLGYRFALDGKVLAYCPDTGYCENAVKLAADADLLITECAYLPGEQSDVWPHLNPEIAAKIAVESKAKRLYLVHFDASRYRTLDDRKRAEETARKVFPRTVASVDDLQVEI